MTDPRLSVPLADLPGFDASGLPLVRILDSRHERCIYDEGSDDEGSDDEGSDDEGSDDEESDDNGNVQTIGVDSERARWSPRKLYALDFADSSTRDRAARWLAVRSGLRAVCGLLWECDCYDGRGKYTWWLTATSVPLSLTHGDADEDEVPFDAPAGVDPEDPTLLPDGSRVVDAAALALVCQHVGGAS